MGSSLEARVGAALGRGVTRMSRLAGGCVGDVRLCVLDDGTRVVAKTGAGPGGTLDVEGYMLRELRRRSSLPTPDVLYAEPTLLVMEYIEHDGRTSDDGERRLADLLADLHEVTDDRFGFDRGTLIGPLRQENAWSGSWAAFFGERRLLAMGREALAHGRISRGLMSRLEAIAARLDRWIDAPARASLIHGDCWAGNVLWDRGRVAALIDPAIYFADPEIELAFIDLMGGVGPAFWARYDERRPIRAGFWEARRDLYNLYPLLVHARLFGGGYASRAEAILDGLGA